jgi:hypothetical protein
MLEEPISKDQDMHDNDDQWDSEVKEIPSDSPSLPPKTPSNASRRKTIASPREAHNSSTIKVNHAPRLKGHINTLLKRLIGFKFQADPSSLKKAIATFKAARDLKEARQAEDKVLEARQCLVTAANLLRSKPNEQLM